MSNKKMTKEFKAARFVNKGQSDAVIAKKLGMTIKAVAAIRNGIDKSNAIASKPIKFYTSNNRIDDALNKIREGIPLLAAAIDGDMVNSPAHYTKGGIETYDFIRAKELSYELGNVVKYVTRAPYKGNYVEDLKKARWYIDAAIRKFEEELK